MSIAIPSSQFTAAIRAAGDAPTLPALRDRIVDIAAKSEAPFIAAGSMLMDVVEALDRIIAAIEGATTAIDRPAASASVDNLKRVADRLMALPEAHAVRTSRMKEVADAAKLLGSNVTAADRTLRIMGIFGMNIGVASEGEPEFAGFVHHMSAKLAEGEHDLARMVARLAQLSDSIARMRGADKQVLIESAQVIPHVPLRLIGDATAIGEHLTASAIVAGQVAATARRVRDQVAVMLGAMQVGDRTRQRLEHVAAGLEMTETCRTDGAPLTATAHCERLLSAQIAATADDFDADARLLADAFVALQPEARQLLQLMEDRTGAGGAGSIAELETAIGEVLKLTKRLCAADDQARAMHHAVAGAIHDLSERLNGVRKLRANVRVIATNIALLCRRHGQIGRGVSAIADQIDVQSAALTQVTEDIDRPIGALLSVSEAMQRDQKDVDLVDAEAILSDAIAILREGTRRSDAATNQRGGDDGQRMIDMVGNAANRIADVRNLGVRIRDCAALLEAQTPYLTEPDDDDLVALAPVLHGLGALYTMAQEREIHARFLPAGSEPSAEAAVGAVDDDAGDEDDDGLF